MTYRGRLTSRLSCEAAFSNRVIVRKRNVTHAAGVRQAPLRARVVERPMRPRRKLLVASANTSLPAAVVCTWSSKNSGRPVTTADRSRTGTLLAAPARVTALSQASKARTSASCLSPTNS